MLTVDNPQPSPRRMLNVHPALLPAFGGKGMYGGRVHYDALQVTGESSL